MFLKNRLIGSIFLEKSTYFLMFSGRIEPSRGPHTARGHVFETAAVHRSWWNDGWRCCALSVGCVIFLKKSIFKGFWNSIPVLSLFPSAKSKKSFVMRKKIEKSDDIIREKRLYLRKSNASNYRACQSM